jgi:hypothetical protein
MLNFKVSGALLCRHAAAYTCTNCSVSCALLGTLNTEQQHMHGLQQQMQTLAVHYSAAQHTYKQLRQ